MKKIFIILLTVMGVLASPIYVNAGHQHTDSCYSIQGAHTHSGDSVNGGGCYGTPVYHVHTGDATNGGGCYGTPIYHVHEGQAGKTFANGCYRVAKQISSQRTIDCRYNVEGWEGDYYNAKKICSSCGNVYHYLQTYKDPSTGAITTLFSYDPNANPCYHTITETTTVYDLGCGKTEQTVERYELSCGKTTDTIEGYSLSCTTPESAGTKVLTCTTPESVDTPAPTPTPEPAPAPAPVEKQESSYTYKDLNKTMYTQTEINVRNTPSTDGALLGRLAAGEEVKVTGQCNETAWYRIDYNGSAGYVTNLYLGTEEPAETVPVETIPEETVEEVTISIDASDFDFALDYSFTGDGLYVILKPTNSLALADIPYSWDNKVTWNTNTECLFTEPGEYRISVKNVDGEIKTKILTVDFELQTVTIENEETALANANIEEPKSSGIKIPFKAIFIVILVLAAVGGIGFLVFKLLAGAGITAKVIDDGTDVALGTVKFKKKGSTFEVIISDRILMAKDTTLALLPDANALKKYRGYSLTVKSSVGVVETAILNKIEVEF